MILSQSRKHRRKDYPKYMIRFAPLMPHYGVVIDLSVSLIVGRGLFPYLGIL